MRRREAIISCVSMEKPAHDVVVIHFRPRTERGGKVVTCGGRERRRHLFVEGVPIGWKEGTLLR